jgi:uncharacterized protein YjbI with pentapeptide repeats
MKSEILRILQMQQDGKLTQDQAAELLAILADQAREKESSGVSTDAMCFSAGRKDSKGAPGPRGRAPAGNQPGTDDGCSRLSAAVHDMVDTAVGIGATVGRAATVWGTEFASMVHREQAGNTITMSKVDPPAGTDFVFRENLINVSKLSDLSLQHAELSYNGINASRVAHLEITHGRLSQCQVSGSSVSFVTIEGRQQPAQATEATPAEADGAAWSQGVIRGVTLSATKFARVRVLGGSAIDACTLQASALKDISLTAGAGLRDSKIIDSVVAGLEIDGENGGALRGATIERSNVQGLKISGAALDCVALHGVKISDATFAGGKWTNVRFKRDPLALGGGGRECLLQESRFDNCTLADSEFAGCTFRRTTFRNLNLSGITVRHVDFTGLIIDSDVAFRKAAGIST